MLKNIRGNVKNTIYKYEMKVLTFGKNYSFATLNFLHIRNHERLELSLMDGPTLNVEDLRSKNKKIMKRGIVQGRRYSTLNYII